MFAVGLSYMAFIMLRYVPSMPAFWRVFFYHKWMLNFVKGFLCIYWDNHMVFIFQFVNVVYYIDWFADIEESLHPWDKAHMVMVYPIIKKAKDILQRYDAEKTVAGEINPIVYFFRAKNYYGMVDKQEHVITANTREESDYSAEDIAKKYLVDGDATFVESTASDSWSRPCNSLSQAILTRLFQATMRLFR